MMQAELTPLKRAFLALEDMQARLDAADQQRREPIAVIGVACRFPGGSTTPETLWQLLREGRDAVTDVPRDRWDIDAFYDPDPKAAGAITSRRGGFIEDVDQFDPLFFNIAPREAVTMDPQQRLMLEVAWEALERAGQMTPALHGSDTGVFVGVAASDYVQLMREAYGLEGIDSYFSSGMAHSVVSGRLSYVMGLQGPSLSVDTACSSSLVATHLAVQSLRSGECSMAIAGGVNLILTPENSVAFSRYQMLSPNGQCRAFDAGADGFVRGEGCGAVVLKRLSAAVAAGDPILAVIRGSAVNQDGPSSGLTAPNGPAQEAVVRAALANSGVGPADVGYVEAHGTGTALGDPIEVQALGRSLGAERTEPFVIGSVKTNLGHLEAAAGITGLIKAVLMVQHGEIPPHLHFETPSPHIPWDRLPVEVSTELKPWRATAAGRIAGVSSFGFSGTNAHIVLGEAPEWPSEADEGEAPLRLMTVSARTDAALREQAGRYAAYLDTYPEADVRDVCRTSNACRLPFEHRLAIPFGSASELQQNLERYSKGHEVAGIVEGQVSIGARPKVALLFTGQGSQYPGMGRTLYAAQPVFRDAIDRCDEILAPLLGCSIRTLMFAETDTPEADLIHQTAYTQPTLFALEYALFELWRSLGVTPSVVMGHSVGEVAAAHVAGVFGLEDALRLVATRGRLMQALPAEGASGEPVGTMAAVMAEVDRVEAAVNAVEATYGADSVSVAAYNGPEHVVVSGRAEAIEALAEALEVEGVSVRRLKVSHAFHSALMEPMLEAFAEVARTITYHAPTRARLVSNVTGTLAGPEIATPDYWVRHVREAVRFEQGIRTLWEAGCDVILEAGPHPVLLGMARTCVEAIDEARFDDTTWVPSMRRGQSDEEQLASSVGRLFAAGVQIDWSSVSGGRCLALPTYPFQRKRYWVPEPKRPLRPATTSNGGFTHPILGRRLRSALSTIQFEQVLATQDLAVLDDHRVFGRAVMPATAYVEAALAAARETHGPGEVVLEDTTIQEALIVEEEPRLVQFILMPERNRDAWAFYSEEVAETGDWKRHAEGRLRVEPVSEPERMDLGALRERCRGDLSSEEHYERLRSFGLAFGPSLHGMVSLRGGQEEALGEVRLPDVCDDDPPYCFHPALLDACLQALVATGVTESGALFMPVGWDTLRVCGEPGDHLFSHVVLRLGEAQETRTADIRICDPEGRVVLTIDGLRLKRATPEALRAEAAVDRHLYEVNWELQPLANSALHGPMRPREIVDAVKPRFRALRSAHQLERWDALAPELEILSVDYVLQALRTLGWDPEPGSVLSTSSLAESLAIVPTRRSLLRHLLSMLEAEGYLSVEGEQWAVLRPLPEKVPKANESRRAALLDAYPEYETELTLVGQCGPYLASVLRGTVDPLHLLFPEGSSTLAERLYSDAPLARVYGTAAAEVIAAVQQRTDGELRILEVGGGTGGLTSFVLPLLAADTVTYTFTDVSPLFVARARERFAKYPFLQFGALDAERDPMAQGFEVEQYDMIVAANVIHATKDLRHTLQGLRQLLAPGGALVLLEMTQPMRWIDITFGLTDGWWHFTDTDVRPDYPLLSPTAWEDLLSEVGFDSVGVLPDGPVTPEQAIIIARAGQQSEGRGAQEDWLIFADEGGVGDRLATYLREAGDRCVVVRHGADWGRQADNEYRIGGEADGIRRVVEMKDKWDHIVHLWSLDAKEPEDVRSLEAAQEDVLGGLLRVVQAAARREEAPRVWIGTRGAQAVGDTELALAQAATWGVGKVVELEHPELRCTRIDLDPAEMGNEADVLLHELKHNEQEGQVAYRKGERRVARLVRSAVLEQKAGEAKSGGLKRLAIAERGTLGGLAFEPTLRRVPGSDEIEIEVRASGLNFKDVLKTLGMAEDGRPIGAECVGIVVAVGEGVADFGPGDRVIAIGEGCFSPYVTVPAAGVVPMPSGLSFAEAATLPVTFITAAFALRHLGHLVAGERVLIHAAAGGVGMAAVQIALRTGAEVFGTAGSPEKRALLASLGVHHVMDSRSLDFADEIRSITDGEGVDVVLNSLADDFIPASISVLREGGRFLELGKRGLLSDADVAKLSTPIKYTAIDWSITAEEDPTLIQSVLAEVVAEVEASDLEPLPFCTFPLPQAVDAFRFMAQARHIGKVVLTQSGRSDAPEAVVRPEHTYLITGGLGGLGLRVARWLADHGATHLALVGRRAPSASAQDVLEDLEVEGVHVRVIQGDIAKARDVDAVLATIREEMPALRGIIHAAGTLDDGALLHQTWERFAPVLAPKVSGAWLLHERTRRHPLDFFVLFSSAASLLGSAGQSNHAAANMFMDVLAHQRRREGLPALSINWGVWSEVGAAAERGMDAGAAQQGLGVIAPEEGVRVFGQLLDGAPPQVGVVPVFWDTLIRQQGAGSDRPFYEHLAQRAPAAPAAFERGEEESAAPDLRERIAAAAPAKQRPMLVEYVAGEVRRVLGLDGSDRVDPRRPLNEQGMDSLMAVELRNRLKTGLALDRGLPATLVFDYPTIEAVADYLVRDVLALETSASESAAPATNEPVDPENVMDMLDTIEQLSADEVERLLTK